MERTNIINPYLQMSRLVGKDLDFGMVEHFVVKYIDDAVRYRGQSFSDAANDLKEFFHHLSNAIFQATVNYDDRMIPVYHDNNFEIQTNQVELDDELLSVEEVSKILKVTPQQVRNLIKSGKLTSIKVSERGTRIKKSDFEEFMSSRNLK